MAVPKLDKFYTPRPLATKVVEYLFEEYDFEFDQPKCLEPHSGSGSFVAALRKKGVSSIITCDQDASAAHGDVHHVSLFEEFAEKCSDKFDLIVGNPPFSDAQRQIESALSLLAKDGILAFLLPLQFVSSVSRRQFFADHMPTKVLVVRPRPSFTEGGSDMREIALFIWDSFEPNGYDMERNQYQATIDFLDWPKPRKTRAKK